jgi:hypothetical protein
MSRRKALPFWRANHLPGPAQQQMKIAHKASSKDANRDNRKNRQNLSSIFKSFVLSLFYAGFSFTLREFVRSVKHKYCNFP